MRTTDLLHYAFRARDPEKLGHFYADLLEGDFFLQPVMTGLGIIIVKLNRPQALFDGLLEFWPWDVVWDGAAAVFRKVQPAPSPTSYGHLAVKVALSSAQIVAELQRRGIPHRMEPRAPGFFIPTIDDPEGNMIELFPNLDHLDVPPEAFCPRDKAKDAIAALRRQFEETNARRRLEEGYPLLPR